MFYLYKGGSPFPKSSVRFEARVLVSLAQLDEEGALYYYHVCQEEIFRFYKRRGDLGENIRALQQN